MNVIPVLDLQGSVVVRAKGGDRAAYRPIETPLSASPRPRDVLEGLLSLAPFATVYVADLDAIAGRAPNRPILDEMLDRFQTVSFWVDAGLQKKADLGRLPSHARLRPVIGSETWRERGLAIEPNAVLSLDFRGATFLGPEELIRNPDRWPGDVIVMALHAVGSDAGPDIGLTKEISARAGKRRTFAAGGVRNAADLESLSRVGAAGALVSSAIHSGALKELFA